MTKNATTFKFVKISGPMYECECCGCYSATGVDIYVNDELVWRKYFDGHMGGEQTENSLLYCVTKAWNETNIGIIEAQYTEEGRHTWNKEHPGNGIARTPESWKEQKETMLEFQKDSLENVLKSCENLPYDELLQIKMIALWIESDCGEKITIEEDSFYEANDSDYEFEDDM
jgi:hypothetical protein